MDLEEAIEYLKDKLSFKGLPPHTNGTEKKPQVFVNKEAIETVLQALEDRKKDIENYEKMYEEEEEEICKLNTKICNLLIELENKDKQIIALNEIIDEEM